MITEEGMPVTSTDNAGAGLTKPELPVNMFAKYKGMVKRAKERLGSRSSDIPKNPIG